MTDDDLGQATIVYEGPDGDTVERTVDNEHVAYFQDHWVLKTGENEDGKDTVRRVPAERVYYVEREVEAFEQEVATLLDDLESVADEVGQGVDSLWQGVEAAAEDLGSALGGDDPVEVDQSEVHRIDVTGSGEDGDDEHDGSGADDEGATEGGDGTGTDDWDAAEGADDGHSAADEGEDGHSAADEDDFGTDDPDGGAGASDEGAGEGDDLTVDGVEDLGSGDGDDDGDDAGLGGTDVGFDDDDA